MLEILLILGVIFGDHIYPGLQHAACCCIALSLGQALAGVIIYGSDFANMLVQRYRRIFIENPIYLYKKIAKRLK